MNHATRAGQGRQEGAGESGRAMPQRIAEDRIPPKGPSVPDRAERKRRAVSGLTVALVILVIATIWLLVAGPIR